MPGLDADPYRERERQWREEAIKLLPGHERDACRVLADGYARIVTIIERLHPPQKSPDSEIIPAMTESPHGEA